MSLGPIYEAAAALGQGVAGGYENYEAAHAQRRQLLAAEAVRRFNAGDVQGAYQLGKMAGSALGLAGPKLVGTYTSTATTTQHPAMVEQPRPTPAFQGPMPWKETTVPETTTSRTYDEATPDFKNQDNVRAVAGMLGVARPTPSYHNVRDVGLVEVTPGYAGGKPSSNVVATVPEKSTVIPRGGALVKGGQVVASNPITVDPLDAKLKQARINKLSTVDPVDAELKQARLAKLRNGPLGKPMTEKQIMDTAKAKWHKPYPVEERDRHNRPTGFAKGMPGVKIQDAIQSWNQGVDTIADELRDQQAAGKGAGAPVVGGALGGSQTRQTPFGPSGSMPPVPVDYNDTRLLPEVEGHAQAITKAVPGTSITSRARSEARNREAGGVADSNHKYRQAFDVVGPRNLWPAIVQAAEARGLEAIPEPHPEDPRRAHVHVQVRGQQQLRTAPGPATRQPVAGQGAIFRKGQRVDAGGK